MWAPAVCILFCMQSTVSFLVTLKEDNSIFMALEETDMRENFTAYAVKIAGEQQKLLLTFEDFSRPALPLVFNASQHGLCYTVSLIGRSGLEWSKPIETAQILTKPLPVENVFVHDYKTSPETGVVFEMKIADNNAFTRVNISYVEGTEQRSMLYKDFSKGKTVFKHWLPGMCYSNITFQLLSEATINKTKVVQCSRVSHKPQRHRTVPEPPRNVTFKIVQFSHRSHSRQARQVPPTTEEEAENLQEELEDAKEVEVNQQEDPDNLEWARHQQEPGDPQQEVLGHHKESMHLAPQPYERTSQHAFSPEDRYNTNSTEEGDSTTQLPWPSLPPSPTPTEEDEGFVNAPVSEYEDYSEPGSAVGIPLPPAQSRAPGTKSPLLLELRWLPPAPPTVFHGFRIYIETDGNSTDVATVDEKTHEFFTELIDPGVYRVQVTTISSLGECEARESIRDTSFTFYIDAKGLWYEQPKERPHVVTVRLLGSTTAAVSWAPTHQTYNATIVSVLSLTCLKPSTSQRMESSYCSEENSTSDIITDLTPGAQYRIVIYHVNGPLASPPSDPIIFGIEPTGVRDLVVYPLGPTAVILSWQRPYHVAFRKYVVETLFFNPITLTAKWSTYYEVAATASLTSSVRITDLLPAWHYSFRVTMVTWSEPPLSCCDGSTVSYVTAPEAPHITSVDYSSGTLYLRWTYGDVFTDLSHSRMLHWQVVAEGKKSLKKRISIDVTRTAMKAMLALAPGDIYNLTVTACTESSRNTSVPRIIKLEPAPPRSLYAVNSSHTSLTLVWVELGVVDFYQIACRPAGTGRELKGRELQTVHSHTATITGLQPASAYNCSVTSFSYSTPSEPAYVTAYTRPKEMNPGVAAISALAILSVLLVSLLALIIMVLRKKHIQMTRECNAGTFINFTTFERDGKLPYNWRRSLFAFLTLLPSCLWTDYLLAFYINPWGKTALKKRKLTCPVPIDDFESYVRDMSKDSAYKFSMQFEELKTVGVDHSHDAAELPVNRAKNRYTNILPYDFSRVKLISMYNDEGSDYINANYIPGNKTPSEYIATQGPLPETRNDFWKMVLQQRSHVIVMLTQCNERRRVKCDHYWPFTDEPVAYGEITVEMLSEKESPEWTVRNFMLGYADETLDVVHLNYTSWPDHGVPTVNAIESILQFVCIARQHAERSRGPVVVHCSAGVGRTGTFIALDRLMQQIRDQETLDILGMVAEMRSHRVSMVQTEEQYMFIHKCVQLMCRKKKQPIDTSEHVFCENVAKA